MEIKSKLLTIGNALMSVVFLLCLAVQYNDPDTLRWMAIYGLAALACLFWFTRRLRRQIPAGIALIAAIWAVFLLPDLIGKELPAREVFGTMHMISQAVEEAREFLGLLIVALWMLVLALDRKRATAQKI